MAKGSGGGGRSLVRGAGFQGRFTGGRISARNLQPGDRIFRPGATIGAYGGLVVTRVNRASLGVVGGRVSVSDVVGGYVQRGRNVTKIGQ